MAPEEGSPTPVPIGVPPTEGAAEIVFTEAQIGQLADVFIEHTRSMRGKISGYLQFAVLGTVGVACLSAAALAIIYGWVNNELAKQFIGSAAQLAVIVAQGLGASHSFPSHPIMLSVDSAPIVGGVLLATIVLLAAGGTIAMLWIEAPKARDELIDDAIISITDHMVRQCECIAPTPGAEITQV